MSVTTFLRRYSQPARVAAAMLAVIALVALTALFVGALKANAAGSAGPGFVITTTPGSQPGSGNVTVDLTLDIPDSIIVPAVISGGGTYTDGSTSLSFDLQGPSGKQVFSQSYQCANGATIISILDVNGGVYASVVAEFAPGECAPADGDDDGDGVKNSVDQCPNTPAGVVVDKATGCEPVVVDGDDDGDGVKNSVDQCDNSAPKAQVDDNGCTIGLKPTVTSDNHTPAQDGVNGVATVTVANPNQVDITYQVTVDGKNYGPLTVPAGSSATFDVTLPQGTYPSAVRAAGQTEHFDVLIGYLAPVVIGVVVKAPTPNTAAMNFTVADQEGVEWITPEGKVVTPGVHPAKWGESFNLTARPTSKLVVLSGVTEWKYSFPEKSTPTVTPTPTHQPTVAPVPTAKPTATPTKETVAPAPVVEKTQQPAKPDYNRGISTDTAATPAASDTSSYWGVAVTGLIVVGLLLVPARRRYVK